MKLSRNVILSIEILTAHKLRTFLSIIGIVVGVGAVILMVSAGRGAETGPAELKKPERSRKKGLRPEGTLVERLRTANFIPPPVGRNAFSQPSGRLPSRPYPAFELT